MDQHDRLIWQMTAYEENCPQRIQHFLKVTSFAELIGRREKLDDKTYRILHTAAVVHDIGIRPSLEKFGSAAGEYQQIEGPPVAERLLHSLGYKASEIERVCYLIAHHHTYHDIDGLDYQILVEADFLVNIFEHDLKDDARTSIRDSIFCTAGGLHLFDTLYPRS